MQSSLALYFCSSKSLAKFQTPQWKRVEFSYIATEQSNHFLTFGGIQNCCKVSGLSMALHAHCLYGASSQMLWNRWELERRVAKGRKTFICEASQEKLPQSKSGLRSFSRNTSNSDFYCCNPNTTGQHIPMLRLNPCLHCFQAAKRIPQSPFQSQQLLLTGTSCKYPNCAPVASECNCAEWGKKTMQKAFLQVAKAPMIWCYLS